MAKKNGSKLSVLVQFGDVGIGQETARVGVTIDRSALDLMTADQCFCGKRLIGKIILGRKDDSDGQGKLIEDTDYEVDGAFDVKGINVKPGKISAGLTFSLASINVSELAKFAKGSGRMVVNEVQELPEPEEDEFEPADVGPSAALKADGPWRHFKLDKIFDGAILKSLNSAGLNTVGDMHNWTASEKRLTDIKGIGEGKAGQIEEGMMRFWESNPESVEDAAAGAA
jgi:hypothetical protein